MKTTGCHNFSARLLSGFARLRAGFARLLVSVTLAGGVLAWGSGAAGQAPEPSKAPPNERIEALPPEAKGIGVDEYLKRQLPLDTNFYDEQGNSVTLGSLFTDGKPVILQLGYFGCPKLCDLVAQSTIDSIAKVDLGLGKDFKVIYVSIDPNERPELAKKSKQAYIKRYAVNGTHDAQAADRGWHFLTGGAQDIAKLAETVGFRYRWIDSAKQYSHPAVIMFITPDGVVSRYLYGAKFDPQAVRLSLVDASAGKTGSVMDQIIMLCFHFDPNTGRYSLQALTLMKAGGVVTIFGLAGMVGLMAMKGRQMRGIGTEKPRRGLAAVVGEQR